VGRAPLLARLVQILSDSPGVVSLVGPGGVGKTRLAAALAEAWGHTTWVDLQGVADGAGLQHAVAHALRSGPQVDTGDALAGFRGLLVLDNLEQLLPGAASVVEGWVRGAEQLRLVVTSREPMGITAELVVDIDPLTPEDAGKLFVDAAPDTLQPEDALLARVLRKLDGLPLALELAAARLDVMSLAQLAARLDDPLTVLRDPTRPGQRHGGMLQALRWSWDQLEGAEQGVLRQCATFRGGFSLEAAEGIVRTEGHVVDLLQRLRRRRLIDFDGARFSMLGMIRAFVESQAQDEQVDGRHGEWFARLAATLTAQLTQAGAPEALEALALDVHNFQAARTATPAALPIALALGALLQCRGPASALLPFLNEALAQSWGPHGRSRLLRQRSAVLAARGRIQDARGDLQEALELAADDPALAAQVKVRIADMLGTSGELHKAREMYRAALAGAEGKGLKAAILTELAVIAHDLGELQDARRLQDEALALAISAQAPMREARIRGLITSLALELLDHDMAESQARAALELYQRLQIPRSVAFSIGQLGHVDELRGQLERARQSYQQAVDGAIAADDLRMQGSWLGALGRVELALGLYTQGRVHLTAGLDLLVQAEVPRMADEIRGSLSVEAAIRGDLQQAELHGGQCVGPLPAQMGRVAVISARAAAAQDAALLDEATQLVAQVAPSEPMRRILDRLLDVTEGRVRAVLVAEDGCWLQTPGSAPVTLRGANARVLAHLLAVHGQGPLGPAALFEAGWPGETVGETSARNRVYVALAALRKAGLRDHLVKERGGWMLNPSSMFLSPD
jgi:tetratricopeptide (TPR) repeat protein